MSCRNVIVCHYVQEERGSYVSITHDTLNLTQAPPPPPSCSPLATGTDCREGLLAGDI